MKITKSLLNNIFDVVKVMLGVMAGILVALVFLIAVAWFNDHLNLDENFRFPPPELILSD